MPQGRIRPQDLAPDGWELDRSRRSDQVYYRNLTTGETTWTRPAPPPAPGDAAKGAQARLRTPGGSVAAPSTPASQGSAVSGANNIVCICQVCECGQHRCRLLEAQAHYDDINTMYQAHYPWHPTQQRAVVREQKPYLRTAHDPQHFRTNYGASFVEHAVRQESVRPKSAPPVKTKFSHKSTYQVEHGDKGVQNRMSKKRGDVRPVKVPFTHKSTNQTDFVQVAAEKRHLLRPPSSAVPNTSFNGTSTYGVAFKPYEAAGATRAKRSAALHVLPEDRDFLSMKQASYTQPPLSLCPAASLAKTSAPKSGHTQLRMSEGGKKGWQYA